MSRRSPAASRSAPAIVARQRGRLPAELEVAADLAQARAAGEEQLAHLVELGQAPVEAAPRDHQLAHQVHQRVEPLDGHPDAGTGRARSRRGGPAAAVPRAAPGTPVGRRPAAPPRSASARSGHIGRDELGNLDRRSRGRVLDQALRPRQDAQIARRALQCLRGLVGDRGPGLEHALDRRGSREDRLGHRRRDGKPMLAHRAEEILDLVGGVPEGRAADRVGRALERVGGPEDGRERVLVARAALDGEQGRGHGLQMLGGLGHEVLEDLAALGEEPPKVRDQRRDRGPEAARSCDGRAGDSALSGPGAAGAEAKKVG